MLINQWLLPSPKRVHDAHLLLSLRCEARYLLALDNWLTGSGIEKVCEYSWAVAAFTLVR